MTATTATTTTTITAIEARRGAGFGHVRRLARAAGSILAAAGSRWSDLVDAGQLGPPADTVTGRHTGARI
jgi:hypothetical protein